MADARLAVAEVEQLTHQHLQAQESLVLQVVEQEIDKVVEHNQEEPAIHRQLVLHKEMMEVVLQLLLLPEVALTRMSFEIITRSQTPMWTDTRSNP